MRLAIIPARDGSKRTEDLGPSFHDVGQFYWGDATAWLSGICIFSEASVPVLLPRHRVHDIDTLEDWNEAELFFECLKNNFSKK